MAITQRRLQQIIQEEVDFYLREQDEEGEAARRGARERCLRGGAEGAPRDDRGKDG